MGLNDKPLMTIRKGWEGGEGFYVQEEHGKIVFAQHKYRGQNINEVDIFLPDHYRQILGEILVMSDNQNREIDYKAIDKEIQITSDPQFSSWVNKSSMDGAAYVIERMMLRLGVKSLDIPVKVQGKTTVLEINIKENNG